MVMVSRRFSLTQIHWVIVLYELLAFNTWDLGPGAGPVWWNSKNLDDHRCGLQSPFADDRLQTLVKVTIGFPWFSTSFHLCPRRNMDKQHEKFPSEFPFHHHFHLAVRALGSRRCCPRWRSGNAMPSASVPGNWRASSGPAERRKKSLEIGMGMESEWGYNNINISILSISICTECQWLKQYISYMYIYYIYI